MKIRTKTLCLSSALSICLLPIPQSDPIKSDPPVKKVHCRQDIDPVTGKVIKVCGEQPKKNYSKYPASSPAKSQHTHTEKMGDAAYLFGMYGLTIGSDWEFAKPRACLYQDDYAFEASPSATIVQAVLQSKTNANYYAYVYTTVLDASPNANDYSTVVSRYSVGVSSATGYNKDSIEMITNWYPQNSPSQMSGSIGISFGTNTSIAITNNWESSELIVASTGGSKNYQATYDINTFYPTPFNTNAVRFTGGFVFSSKTTSFDYFDVTHILQFVQNGTTIDATLPFTLGITTLI